jgi:hypothetical protein
MWAGVVYDTLLERHAECIMLSGGTQIFRTVGVPCDFPVGTYLKVTDTEIHRKTLARGIRQADSFHAQETTPPSLTS